MKLPPIKLRRLYMNEAKTGDFIIRAEDLPADVFNSMTDEERMKRQDEERKSIEAEWRKVKSG